MHASRPLLLVISLVLASVPGCIDIPEDFQATGADAWIYSGYDYPGRTATGAEGSLEVRLDTDGNAGHIRARVKDPFREIEIRWYAFVGRQGYQSGGVARDLDLWGATGNGSGVFPKIAVHAAAWGNASLFIDGKPQREPQALSSTYGSIFFLTKGRYRSMDSHRILKADQNGTFDPSTPADGFVDRQGSQAAILLFTDRGQLAHYVEFNEIIVTRR